MQRLLGECGGVYKQSLAYKVFQIAVRGGLGGGGVINFTGGGNFLLGEGNLRWSDLNNSNLFQS